MRNLIHWNGLYLVKQTIGAVLLAVVLLCAFPGLAAIVFFAVVIAIAVFVYSDQANRKAQQEEIAAAGRQAERDRDELAQLSKIPTSSSGSLRGHRIAKQLRAISVDNFRTQIDAELSFLREVKACGGAGVINMKVFRRRGGFIAITGDAVLLE